ncbi:MAG: GIN domain-containing protein [Paludibacteraceae bacterium]
MKKSLLIIGLALMYALPGFSQTKETAKKTDFKVVSETRNIVSFETIEVSGRFLVKLYPSSKTEVTVTTAEDYISAVETNVENSILKINMRGLTDNKNVNVIDGLKNKFNDFLIRQPIEIRIGVPDISKILIYGITTVETESILKLQNLYININDASKVNLNVDIANNFTAVVSGASKVNITGKTANSQLNVSGASSFEGKDFLTRSSKVSLSGASRAEIHASESLDAELKGATKLICTGSPKSLKQNASRGSSIIVK